MILARILSHERRKVNRSHIKPPPDSQKHIRPTHKSTLRPLKSSEISCFPLRQFQTLKPQSFPQVNTRSQITTEFLSHKAVENFILTCGKSCGKLIRTLKSYEHSKEKTSQSCHSPLKVL